MTRARWVSVGALACAVLLVLAVVAASLVIAHHN